jgi:hypothetical protein
MRRLYKTDIGLTTGFIGSHTVTHNYSVYTPTASQFTIVLAESPYNYNWLSQLSHNSCWVSSGPRTSCRPNWLSLRLTRNWSCLCNGWRPSYIARKQTTKKTLPRNRPQREHGCPIVALGQTTNKTLVASIVACLSVAIATVVNTCHIAYSIHVTICYRMFSSIFPVGDVSSSFDIHLCCLGC